MANNENQLDHVVRIFGTSVYHWAEVVNPVEIGFCMRGIKDCVNARKPLNEPQLEAIDMITKLAAMIADDCLQLENEGIDLQDLSESE